MGTYLSTPVLDKHTEKGSDVATDSNIPVRWAVVDMQGWRKSMEDAHVARTDVPMPRSCSAKQGDDGGGGGDGAGGGGEGENDKNDEASHAKVFAVFDGHGGAEVARFCQMHLVPVLTSQSDWAGPSGDEKGEADSGGNNADGKSMASRVGQSLVDAFHALDRLIDDPSSRPEIDKWRSERPPPYVAEEAEEASLETEASADGEDGETAENEPMDLDEVQTHRQTVVNEDELHMMDAGDDESEDADDSTDESLDKMEEGSSSDEGGETKKEGGDAEKGLPNGTSNPKGVLDDVHGDDDEDEVFEDSLSEPSDDMTNEGADGVVHDDSDDDEKGGKSGENDDESDSDGEVDPNAKTPPAKDQGTMVLSANDAVALFQKLLHMNGTGTGDDDEDDEGEEEAPAENGEKMNGESTGGGESEEGEVVIPTKAQLLNPPTGIVAPSASVPTRIQNGRKICNLPDHPVHAGCTSVVAVIVGRTLVVANAGDSRAVICRAGGLTEPLSFDHKPLQNREMNRITNAGGFVNQFGRVNGNLNLSRSIGDLKYKQVPGIPPAEQMITAEPDILSTTLREGDEFIVLGCDGIWDCLSNEECVKYVRDRIDSKSPQEIGTEMLDEIVSADPRASQGIGGDNMTIMIVDLLPHKRPYSNDS